MLMIILYKFFNILLSIIQLRQILPLWKKLFLGRRRRTLERKILGALMAQMMTFWEMSLPSNARKLSLERLNACLGNIGNLEAAIYGFV